ASFVGHLWQLYASAGVLMAMGAGGLGVATISPIPARWFVARRGLILGILGGAMSAGQMLIVPLSMVIIHLYGWRSSFLWLGLCVVLVGLPPLPAHHPPLRLAIVLSLARPRRSAGGPSPYPRLHTRRSQGHGARALRQGHSGREGFRRRP